MKIAEIMEELNVSDNVLMKIISDPASKKFWEKNYRNNPDDMNQSVVTASGVMAIKEYLAKEGKPVPTAKPKAEPKTTKSKPEPEKAEVKPTETVKTEDEPTKPDPPKRRRRTKAEMEEMTIKVEKASPFLSESQLRQALSKDGVKCRQILVKEGFVKESTLAYTSDEAVLDVMVAKFIGMKERTYIHLYRRGDF